MRNPPNFVVWVLLGRFKKGDDFVPWFYKGSIGHGPIQGSKLALAYGVRSLADSDCKKLRELLGRGNCYVQQYGPYR